MKNNSNLLLSNNVQSIKNILTIGLFAIIIISSSFSNGLIISQAMASGNTTSGGNNTSTTSIDNTSLSVMTNQNTVQSGSQVTLIATVTDTSSTPTSPTGSVSWSDGGAGGSFSSSSCTLSTNTCTTSYTPSSSSSSNVVITASYGGDTTHKTSSSTLSLAIVAIHATSVSITTSSTTIVSGNTATITVTVTDTSSLPTTPSGIISWSDGGAGGSFSSSSCTLATGICTTTYTPSASSPSNLVISASYGGDTTHNTSSGTSSLTVSTIHATTVSITSNPARIPPGGSVNVTATVSDSSSSPTTPTSSVSWSDGNGGGGTFSPSSCTLSSSGSCSVLYTPSGNPPNAITITANYNGDTAHQASVGTVQLSTNALDTTTAVITPNPATFSPGTQVTFTLTITDTSNPSSNIIGLVKWTDNGAGGSFSPDSCIVTSNHCALAYTPPSNLSGSITISASYPGDTTHLGSSATSVLTENVTPSIQSSPNTKPTTQSINQPTSQNPTHPSQTSVNNNQQPQQNPIAVIGRVINNVVSALESLFSKI